MPTARDCVKLIEQYLAGDLGPSDFAHAYDRTYLDVEVLPEDLFRVLDWVFATADSYDPSVTPETETAFNLSEETLRSTCEEAMARLRAMDLDPGDDLREPGQQPRGR